jgi:hypothetical protein
MIYLLDLNWTLVANSTERHRPFSRQIELEEYDAALTARLRSERVVLITARPARHREATLARIQAVLGWQPLLACFNTAGLPPPASKARALALEVFPAFGSDPGLYFGIESNPRTRAMYASRGIPSAPKGVFLAGDPVRA